jgi:hypothetical protein
MDIQFHIFNVSEGIEKVRRSEEDLPADGVSKLIELLMASKEPGWFEAFIEALKAKGLCGHRGCLSLKFGLFHLHHFGQKLINNQMLQLATDW